MHPFLIQIGPVVVPTYGVFAGLALLLAMLATRWFARIEGRDPSQVMDAIFWSIVVGLVGAKVLEGIINWPRYFGTPGGFRLWIYSTGVFLGGLIAAVAFGAYQFHKIRLPALQGLDILAPVAALIEGVGRWGCFFSGCCWGTPCDLPWAVTFPEAAQRIHRGLPAVPLHPTQIYMSLNGFLILAILLFAYRRKRFHGQIIVTFVALYSVSRFFIEYVRGDAERGFVLNGLLSTSQMLSLVLLVVSIAAYIVLDRRHRASGEPDWRPATGDRIPAPASAARRRRGRRRA